MNLLRSVLYGISQAIQYGLSDGYGYYGGGYNHGYCGRGYNHGYYGRGYNHGYYGGGYGRGGYGLENRNHYPSSQTGYQNVIIYQDRTGRTGWSTPNIPSRIPVGLEIQQVYVRDQKSFDHLINHIYKLNQQGIHVSIGRIDIGYHHSSNLQNRPGSFILNRRSQISSHGWDVNAGQSEIRYISTAKEPGVYNNQVNNVPGMTRQINPYHNNSLGLGAYYHTMTPLPYNTI